MVLATARVETEKLLAPDEKLMPVTVVVEPEVVYVGVSVGSIVGAAVGA
jgi:hypothetical protein